MQLLHPSVDDTLILICLLIQILNADDVIIGFRNKMPFERRLRLYNVFAVAELRVVHQKFDDLIVLVKELLHSELIDTVIVPGYRPFESSLLFEDPCPPALLHNNPL